MRPDLRIHIDGASRGNPGPASAGVFIRDSKGEEIKTLAEPIGVATNNVAEYYALIFALEEAAILKAGKVALFSDSELLVKQFKGEYKIKDPTLKLLSRQVKRLAKYFNSCDLTHVPREENKDADRLANEALDRELF